MDKLNLRMDIIRVFTITKFIYGLVGVLLGLAASFLFIYLIVFIWLGVFSFPQVSSEYIKLVAIFFLVATLIITKKIFNLCCAKANKEPFKNFF